MNFQVNNRQMYGVTQNPPRRMQYNTSESRPDTQRKTFMPPLVQTRPVTKTTNSVQSMMQPQAVPKFKGSVSAVGQHASVFNRSRAGCEISLRQQTIAQAFNKMEPSTSAEICVDDRRRARTPFGVSEMSIQDPLMRSTITSGASSVVEFNVSTVSNANQSHNNENAARSNFFKIFGSTENEKMFIFTGTVEKVIKWNKIFRNHFCYYEVIASVISIQGGSVSTQRIMLLRDKKGPILQVVYYNNTHLNIEDFHVGQVLRSLGRMSSPNILNAVSIRSATQEEIDTLQRLSLVCDQAISHFLSV